MNYNDVCADLPRPVLLESATDFDDMFDSHPYTDFVPAGKDELEERYVAAVIALLDALLQRKPADPLEYMVSDILCFPFAFDTQCRPNPTPRIPGSRILGGDRSRTSCFFDPEVTTPGTAMPVLPPLRRKEKKVPCQHCLSVPGTAAYRPPSLTPYIDTTGCCTYELRTPFQKSADETVTILERFLSSNETVLVLIGDDDAQAGYDVTSPRLSMESVSPKSASGASSSYPSVLGSCAGCQCAGAGKTRLARWLQYPGQFIHGRRVISVDSSNTGHLLGILGEGRSHQPFYDDPMLPFDKDYSFIASPQRLLLSSISIRSAASTPSLSFGRRPRKQSMLGDTLGGGQAWRVAEQATTSIESTLTLIDSVEPPHFLLHALHQHNYFRTERALRCPWCRQLSTNVAIHKTIVFTRKDVLFKFPLPCPIFVIARRCGVSGPMANEAERALAEAWSSGRSSTWAGIGLGFEVGDTGERLGDSTRRISGASLNFTSRRLGDGSARSPLRRSWRGDVIRALKEPSWVGTLPWCEAILRELNIFYASVKDVPVGDRSPMSMSCSSTFHSSGLSRGRAELLLASHLVREGILPSFDLSEFPLLCRYMAVSSKVDLFILRTLLGLKEQIDDGSQIERMVIGNLLCLAVRAQQCLSLHTVSVTVHDLLELYLVAFSCLGVRGSNNATPQQLPATPPPSSSPVAIALDSNGSTPQLDAIGSRRSSAARLQSASPQQPLQGTLTFLDLQDIITEQVTLGNHNANQIAPMVANNLLDVRGADMSEALKSLLVRGTTLRAYRRALGEEDKTTLGDAQGEAQSAWALNDSLAPDYSMSKPQPVLLTADASTIGGTAYIGRPEQLHSVAAPKGQIIYCFFVRLMSEGCSAVLVIEKNKIYAQSSFSEADNFEESFPSSPLGWKTERCFWTIVTGTKRGVKFAHMLSQVSLQHEGAWGTADSPTNAAENDVLVLLLDDGTVLFVAINNIPRGAVVRVDRLGDNPVTPHNDSNFSEFAAVRHVGSERNLRIPAGSAGHMPLCDSSHLSASTNSVALLDARQSSVEELYQTTHGFTHTKTYRAGDASDGTLVVVNVAVKDQSPPRGMPFTSPPEQISGSSPESSTFSSVPPLPLLSPEGLFEGPFHAKQPASLIRMDNFLMAVHSGQLNNKDDAFLCCMSPTYIAAVATETFVITVLEHGFKDWLGDHQPQQPIYDRVASPSSPQGDEGSPPPLHRTRRRRGRPVLYQADEDVSALSILQDRYLLVGLVTGDVQVFDLSPELDGTESDAEDSQHARLLHTFQFHEKAVTVIRPLPGMNKASPRSPLTSSRLTARSIAVGRSKQNIERYHCFVTGAADNILTVFSIDDFTPLKSARVHQAPISDICSSNYVANRIIISCDMAGMAVVSALNPNDLQAAFVTVWASCLPVARQLHLSYDGSWLCCTPSNGEAPQAMPIGEWTRLGVGQFHSGQITAMHITICESYLLTGGSDGVIFVWDLMSQAKHVLSFRKHSIGSCINSISTSEDGSKVASSDNQKFVQLWRRSCGTVIRTVDRGDGEAFCRFLPNDYLAVRTCNDFRLYDNSDRLVFRSRQLGGGAFGCAESSIDFYYLGPTESEQLFPFVNTVDPHLGEEKSRRRPTMKPASDSASDEETSESDAEMESPRTLGPSGRMPSLRSAPVDTSLRDAMPDSLRLHCYVGIVNSGSSVSGVAVYRLGYLDGGPVKVFAESPIPGDTTDSDEDGLHHEDSIQSFRFLPSRQCYGRRPFAANGRLRASFVDPFARRASEMTDDGLGDTSTTAPWGEDSDFITSSPAAACKHSADASSPYSLLLAATAADDLTLIVWNWFRKVPLAKFSHTSYINSLVFWYPSVPAAAFSSSATSICMRLNSHSSDGYTGSEIEEFRQHDPTFQYGDASSGSAPLCLLMTTQAATGVADPTLRVFEIRQSPVRQFLEPRTAIEYNRKPMQIRMANSTRRGNETIECAAIRPSDGLVCTGGRELVFWRWMASNPIVSSEMLMARSSLMSTPQKQCLRIAQPVKDEPASSSTTSSCSSVHQPLQRVGLHRTPQRRSSSSSNSSTSSGPPQRLLTRSEVNGLQNADVSQSHSVAMQLRPLRRISKRL